MGNISINGISGGTAPYTIKVYQVGNGSPIFTDTTNTSSYTGTFTHTNGQSYYAVVEKNGCTGFTSGNTTLNCQTCQLTIGSITYTCYNSGIYTASFNISGGSGNYEYSNDNGLTFSPTPSNFSENFLTGSHTILVRDSITTSCSEIVNLNYTNPCNGLPQQNFCNFSFVNNGGVGTYDNSFTHSGASGTIYYKFDDYRINDILEIYVNGNIVVTTGNVSGIKVGSFSLNNNDTVRLLVRATTSTINGQSPNNNTLWEIATNCSTPYTGNNCTTGLDCSSVNFACTAEVVSVNVTYTQILSSTIRVINVRARRRCTNGGVYRHDLLIANLNDDGSGNTNPVSVSGNGINDYADFQFVNVAPGNYTVYIDWMSYSGIIVN